ncbi:MAG: hypothetical protein M1482_05505 [Chloroflexi bacterium]|nr:hypothetical protein [Chloroflexota bacterium]
MFLALPLAQRANVDIAGVRLGALADALHKAGKKTASVGCPGGRESGSPAVRQIGNPAVLAMDSRGQIDYADFRFVPAKGDSCGLLSDVNLLSRRVSLALERADYVIVDFGDTTSLDNMKVSLSDKAYTAHREAALRGLDRLLKNLLADSGVGLVLVSFSPPSPDEWNRLTPIVISTRDTKPGLLTSLTTRTRGLIAASDFAPTILGMMGVSVDQSMLGQKAAGASGTSELASLHVMEKRVVANESLVWPILLFLAFTGALAFFVTSVLVAFSLPISRKISGLLKACLMIGAASPLAMLLAVIAPAGVVGYASGLGVSLVVLVPGALAIGWLLSRVGSSISLPVRVVYAVTVVVLMFDAALGCPLCKFSLPSSYQITAMRFYGIGNEYAGILIAMSAAACLFADLRVRKWAVVLVGALVVSVLGVGSLGANYGATIAAIVTFGLLGTAIWRGGFGTRHVAAWLVIAFALVAGLAFVDLKMAGAAASHAGRATGLAEKIGAGYLFELVSRKMMLNIRLAGTKQSIWVTMSFMPFLALWFWGVQAKVLKTLGKDPSLVAGLKASLIGAAVAFLFNDSGVVMASIMIAMTVLVLVYSLLERPEGGACRE